MVSKKALREENEYLRGQWAETVDALEKVQAAWIREMESHDKTANEAYTLRRQLSRMEKDLRGKEG